MSDTMKKVQSGDPLVIPAATFNFFIDAADGFRRRQQHVGRTPQASILNRLTGTAPLRNDTGADLPRFAVVGVDGPIIAPSDNEDEFTKRATLIGVEPTVEDHRGRFAVVTEPIADGVIGQACVSGVIPAKVNIVDENHTRADVKAGSTTLESGHHGAAELLWHAPGTGEQWALIKIGLGVPLSVTFDVRLVQTGGSPGKNGESECSFTYHAYDVETNELLTTGGPLSPEAPRPAATKMIAATSGTAYWKVDGGALTLVLAEAFEQPTPRQVLDVVTGLSCQKVTLSPGDGGGDILRFTASTTRVFLPNGTRIEPGSDLIFDCPCCGDPGDPPGCGCGCGPGCGCGCGCGCCCSCSCGCCCCSGGGV